jgi:hypothetical protein
VAPLVTKVPGPVHEYNTRSAVVSLSVMVAVSVRVSPVSPKLAGCPARVPVLRMLVMIASRYVGKALPKVPEGGAGALRMGVAVTPEGMTVGGLVVDTATVMADGTLLMAGVAASTTAAAVGGGSLCAEKPGGDFKGHHIATDKNDKGTNQGGPWTPLFRQAVAVYRELIQQCPEARESLEAHVILADILRSNFRDLRGAINELTAAIARNPPQSAELTYQVAKLYFELGDYQQSALEAQRVFTRYETSAFVDDAMFLPPPGYTRFSMGGLLKGLGGK